MTGRTQGLFVYILFICMYVYIRLYVCIQIDHIYIYIHMYRQSLTACVHTYVYTIPNTYNMYK